MKEQITPEQMQAKLEKKAMERAAKIQRIEQKTAERLEKQRQEFDKQQAQIDKMLQKLSQAPQEIEKQLDEFIKILKGFLGLNISPKVDVNSADFDINALLGDFKKVLTPLTSSVEPIESIVGKIPVIGDILAVLINMLTGNGYRMLTTGDLAKQGSFSFGQFGGRGASLSEEEEKLKGKIKLPSPLMAKVDQVRQLISQFCSLLTMFLIHVIFMMLSAIFDMFNQIVGVIGVPSFPFPFNLIKSIPSIIVHIERFIISAPMQVTDIVLGLLQGKFAEALCLSRPGLPLPIPIKVKSKSTAAGKPAPEPTEKPPVDPTVAAEPATQALPPSAPKELTLDEVKEKWSKRFADDYNYEPDKVKEAIDFRAEVFDGSNTEMTYIVPSALAKSFNYDSVSTIKRKLYTADDINFMMAAGWNCQKIQNYLVYQRLMKASEALKYFDEDDDAQQVNTLKSMGDKEVVIFGSVKPKNPFLSWCGF